MQSRLKPSLKRPLVSVKSVITGRNVLEKSRHSWYDRGRGIEDVGEHIRLNYTVEEQKYRETHGIAADVPLNNRRQNAVYRLHVATL